MGWSKKEIAMIFDHIWQSLWFIRYYCPDIQVDQLLSRVFYVMSDF